MVDIFGIPNKYLLDTGASVSIAGDEGTKFLLSIGLKIDYSYVANLKTADNSGHLISGVFTVPVKFKNEEKSILIYSVPTIPTKIIFGIDFFRIFDIMLYFDDNGWSCTTLDFNKDQISKSKNGVIAYHNLSPNQRSRIDDLKEKFKALCTGRLGCTPLVTHVIDTGDALPIKQRGYQVSPAVQERMGKQLNRMLDLGVIERSYSPWSSPVVLVKKKDGGDRLCVDSRKLNSVTVRDSYPLPRVAEILDRLGQTNFLSKIDLKDAFWQIPLSDNSKPKTAFSVPGHGLFQFTRLPFGLHNAAQCLQRLMNSVFGSTDHKIFVYLDDLIITSQDFDEHMTTLEFVFDRLQNANLTINYDKSEFCCSSLQYLGYVVDSYGLHTDPSKVETILNVPLPKNYTELKRFIGLASWYQRFVKNFANIAAPLHELTKGKKKGKTIYWDDSARDAFVKLKNALVSSPVLATPDFSQKFEIHCDASNYGIGVVLCQGPDEHPVAFASRKFRGAETRYSTPEKECLAVLFGIHKFRPYVEGYEFSIITDCSSLTYLFRQENPPDRLARWIMKLSQFKFNVIHRKGTSNVVPDALSRAVEHLDIISFQPDANDSWYIRMLGKVALSPTRFSDWKIKDGKLFYKMSGPINKIDSKYWCTVVPESVRNSVLEECHNHPSAGHMGMKKTKLRILERYYWPGVGKDVDKFVKSCVTCKQVKYPTSKRQGLMGKFKDVTRPFQMLSIDLMGPLPRSTKQNAWLLVITDWVTKFPLLFTLRTATAAKIVDIVEKNVFLLFGVPEIVIADNGKQFSGDLFKKLMAKYGVEKLWFNTRYHPQNNPTERTNKTIGQALRAYVRDNHRLWDAEIGNIGLALRTSVNEITGYSPFFLNFGRNCTYSGTDYSGFLDNPEPEKAVSHRVQFLDKFVGIFRDINSRIKAAYMKNKKYYDKNKVDIKFSVGDIVYKRNFRLSDAANYFSAKLAPAFIPCRVLKKISDLVYELVDLDGKNLGKWHVKDLKNS